MHPPLDRHAHALLLGAAACALSALADLASTILWLAPGPDRLRLAFTLLALGLTTGAVLFPLVTLLDHALATRLPQTLPRRALLLAVPLVPVAHLLFTGGRMRRLPARGALEPLAALALVAVASASLHAALGALLALRARPPAARARAALATLALAQLLHAIDHRVLPRLYAYLHAGLGALTALAWAATLYLLLPPPRRARGLALATLLLALLLGPLAWRSLDAWPNVRAEVFGTHAPFVHHVVLAAETLTGGREARPVDSTALRRARLARQRASAPPAAGALPRLPGAHVLLITLDALRADRLGRPRDGHSLTPTLDALAARSVVFERAYAQAPHSSYSLCSLHTGEYLHETVPLGQAQPLPTLAQVLAGHGHHAAALYTQGIFFTEAERLTAYRDVDLGFPRAVHVDRDARAQAEAAARELDDLVRRGEPPGFLWVHFFDAHAPYQGRGASPEARYDDAVHTIDEALGALLAHARRVLARDLMIAVTADHGEEFGEHGGVYHGSTLYDEQLRVPLLVHAPGVAPRRVAEPVELVDVAPTLCALAGVPPAPSMRGRDLRPAMTATAPARPVFAAVNTRRMVFRAPYKLVADVTYGVDELYDLALDPGERRNLAGTHGLLRDELRAELHAWLESLVPASGPPAALARARLGDRASGPGLAALARDVGRPASERREALEHLARFGDPEALPLGRALLRGGDRTLADAAAIALGAAGDRAARARLLDLVVDERPATRHAAAMALARLGDPRAVPALVEGLWTRDDNGALDALRALGRLGSPDALEAILTVLPDDHLRYRAVLALGQLHDPRAFATLAELALQDPTDDVRANAVAALGELGDRRAVPLLVDLLAHATPAPYAAEALARLGVIGTLLPGFDARRPERTPARDLGACGPHEDTLGWRYLAAASCVSTSLRPAVTLRLRDAGRRLLVFRARRGDDGPALPLALLVDGQEQATATLSPQWQQSRLELPFLPPGDHTLAFELRPPPGTGAVLRLDHVLLLSRR